MQINVLLNYFNNTKQLNSNSYQCSCPTHSDKKASLTITDKGDKILMKCHAGCSTNTILQKVGLKMSDLYTEQKTINWKSKLEYWKKKEIEAVYTYTDEEGNYTYTKVRFVGKEIIYGIIDKAQDKFNVGLMDVKKGLYRLPALLKSKDTDKPVYFVEGEKDVDTLASLGYVATTCGGVSDWKQEYSEYFKGRSVIILPDNDEAGRSLAKQVFNDIKKYAFQVKTVITSNQAKGDVTDYLTTEKHTKFNLDTLVYQTSWINARYLYETTKGELKINADILAQTVKNSNKILITTKNGVDKEIIYIYRNGVYEECSKAQLKGIIKDYIPIGKSTDSLLNNTVNLMICPDNNSHDFDDINTNENIINLKNGIYNIKTRMLEKHCSNILSTLQLNCSYFPEKANTKKPVKWIKFIEELCTDQDGKIDWNLYNIYQEQTGLILSNCYVYRTKKAFILYSPIGNTGKSVYLSVINKMVGEANVTNIPMQKMSDRFSLGDIYGKRIISIGDQTSQDIEDCSNFKQLTGGDRVNAELKGKQSYNFTFTGGIMIACNNLPYFADDKGNHVFDRMLILPCTNVIPASKRNKGLIEELMEEADAIFAWGLEGLHRLIKNNFEYTKCNAVDEVITDYRNNIDTLYHYVNSECQITENKMDRIKKTEFEENYTQWCERNGYTPVSKKNIKERTTKIGIPMIRTSESNYYQYIKYKDFSSKTNLNSKENNKINAIFEQQKIK